MGFAGRRTKIVCDRCSAPNLTQSRSSTYGSWWSNGDDGEESTTRGEREKRERERENMGMRQTEDLLFPLHQISSRTGLLTILDEHFGVLSWKFSVQTNVSQGAFIVFEI
jgi:hypothetical protein